MQFVQLMYECVHLYIKCVHLYIYNYIYILYVRTYAYFQLVLTLVPYFQEYDTFTQPHPLKSVSLGRPVVMAPLIIYSDDTSGNKSKKWNCFNSWFFLLAGLPRQENSQLRKFQQCVRA